MVGDSMRKRALRKDFYMEIKKSFNRFISIFFIVALGVAFYAGIQSAAPDMEITGDAYFDNQNLMDFKVMGTLGLTEDDVEALQELDGVKNAEGAYMTDVLYGEDASQKVVHLESITKDFQKLQVLDGALPVSADECFVDIHMAEAYGIQVGDTLTVREDGDEEDHVLKQTSFQVVGLGASPAYIAFGRGNTTLGSGEVTGFGYVMPEAFDLEVYTQIFLEAEGAKEATAFTESYEEVIEAVREAVEGIEEVRCEARYSEIRDEANEKITDAKEELEDGKKEAEEKLAEAKAEIEDGETKLQEGKDQLEQGKKDLEEAKQKVEDGKAELEEKQQELDEAKAEVADGWTKLASGKEEFAEAEAQFESEKTDAEEQISTGKTLVAASRIQYNQGLAQYEEGLKQLEDAYMQLAFKEALLQQNAELSPEGQAAYEAAKPELEAARTQLDAQKSQLTVTKTELDAAWTEISTQETQIETAEAELEEGAVQIEAARAELAASEASLNSAQAEIDEGQARIDEGWEELAEGEQEIADAEADIAEAEATIEENEQKLTDGRADYEEAEKEIEDTIADGEKKIADAEKELEDLEYPEWIVYDRDDLSDYTGYGENVDRMQSLGQVFPVLFFLVAALISLTTMTRMVEEERTQIGTLKALGYSKLSIAKKFIYYAVLATVGGSVLGVLAGEKLIPWVIITAYGIMYKYMDTMVLNYQMDHALVASGVALFCTMAGTISASARELAATPAVLMRPPAPKEGKRVLLERIPFIWKHLSFTWKSTIRNLFRYKKRFFMTVFGISGCMGLLLVGFGIRDSIMDVGTLQYEELQVYDGILILNEDASGEELKQLEKVLTESEEITAYRNIYMKKMNMKGEEGQYDVYLMVPETIEAFDTFVHTRDRKTKEIYTLGEEGMILTEKTASILGAEVGDQVSVALDETHVAQIPVSAICENYMSHYAYVSPALYEKTFGELPENNNILFCTSQKDEAFVEQTGQQLLKEEAALSISYTASVAERLDEMLGALDLVIIVLIVSAGMLAFVVLYNLNNININERKRELATLKVLGFYDREVSAYVYRENILLTIIGAAGGVVLGLILHRFVITTVEIDEYMFGRNVNLFSHVISIAITCGFSLIVNWVMHFKLKKIDMVESLKSVE